MYPISPPAKPLPAVPVILTSAEHNSIFTFADWRTCPIRPPAKYAFPLPIMEPLIWQFSIVTVSDGADIRIPISVSLRSDAGFTLASLIVRSFIRQAPETLLNNPAYTPLLTAFNPWIVWPHPSNSATLLETGTKSWYPRSISHTSFALPIACVPPWNQASSAPVLIR